MFVVRNCSTILLGASNKAAQDTCPRGLKRVLKKSSYPKRESLRG
jgi:hypothetical protein